jgi:BASS family bile acid:Na+ symporter
MAFNHYAPDLARRVERWARPVATAIFAAIVVATFASQWTVMMQSFASLGPAVLALNLSIMALGKAAAAGLGLPPAQATAIMIEGGMRNAALGILVSVSLLGEPRMSVPSITYALIMNLTVLALVAALRRRANAGRVTSPGARADRGA